MTDRLVLVGVGDFGRCWEPAIDADADVEVVAVVDPDTEARELAAKFYGVTADHSRADVTRLPADLRATAVIDSSPFVHRRKHASWAFGHGLDLLAAKPFGASLAEAEHMTAEAARRGRRVAVAQQVRYFPCFTWLRDRLAAGRFGSVRSVEVDMALDGRGWAPGTEWRSRLDQPLLLEAGIHHFDLMRWCLSEEVALMHAEAWNPPWSPFSGPATVAALLRTEAGTPISYHATFAPRPDQAPVRFDSGWRICCDDAMITVVDGGVLVNGEPTELAPTAEPVPLEDLNGELFQAWRQRHEPPFTGVDNLRSMTILDHALRSVRGPGR